MSLCCKSVPMKKSIVFYLPLFVLLLSFAGNKVFGQTLPDFKLKLMDGSTLSTSQLSHKEPVLLIYFAPDCEHCRTLMKELLPQINAFKNVQILMPTFESPDDVRWFINHFQTNKYPNIKVGIEEPVFFLKNYYKLEHTPFTALFNKNGKLMVSYKEYTPVSELIKWVKAISK